MNERKYDLVHLDEKSRATKNLFGEFFRILEQEVERGIHCIWERQQVLHQIDIAYMWLDRAIVSDQRFREERVND